MGFNAGIMGLPNVGKSTIFNAMTGAGAAASNYPFTTIDPNVGMVGLADERLDRLAELCKPEKATCTAVEFVDIAGLVKGASRGEGLGNRFLGHIREVELLVHVVRCFSDPDVVRVEDSVDPEGDIEVVETELMLADLETVERALTKAGKLVRAGDKGMAGMVGVYEELKGLLEKGTPARGLAEGADEAEVGHVRELNLLTMKPVIYVANVGEDDLAGLGEGAGAVRKVAEREGAGFVPVSGKVEAELSELTPPERAEFLRGLGLEESGLTRLARAAYGLLGLITFFTVVGKNEVRAWTLKQGSTAPRAAGVVHTDFERGFIKAEVVHYDDFVAHGSEARARDKGLQRLEGRDYVVRDGDIIHFRHSN
jgi:GTP-binding protein YchF